MRGGIQSYGPDAIEHSQFGGALPLAPVATRPERGGEVKIDVLYLHVRGVANTCGKLSSSPSQFPSTYLYHHQLKLGNQMKLPYSVHLMLTLFGFKLH